MAIPSICPIFLLILENFRILKTQITRPLFCRIKTKSETLTTHAMCVVRVSPFHHDTDGIFTR